MSRLVEALERHARRRPGGLAVDDGRVQLSWRELRDEVERLAGRLARRRSPLGLLLENGAPWAAADLATLQAGRTCLPLPRFFSDAQLGHALSDAGVEEVLCDTPETVRRVAGVAAARPVTIAGRRLSLLRLERREGLHLPGVAKITYTSGTTGTPKGVPLSLDRLEETALALAEAASARAMDRALALLPLPVLLENIGSIHVPVVSGATMLLPSSTALGWEGTAHLDPGRLAAALARLQPTAAILTPELLKLFLHLRQQERLPGSFRFLAVGGAPVPAGLLEAATRMGLPVFQGYGLSEAASVVSLNRPGANRPGSCGRPLPGLRIRVAGDGEILVRGSGFCGYLHQPADDEWLATGDLGHLDEEGFLHVRGRKGEVIINSFGRNLSPEWVEAGLLGEAAIRQAAVFGEGRPWLSAVIVPAEGVGSDEVAEAVERANRRLPDYARVRAWIPGTGFLREKGELTANGRPRRNIIFEHYRSPLEALHESESTELLRSAP